jgi:hypothetical protein
MFPRLPISEREKLARQSKARRYLQASSRQMCDDLRRRCLTKKFCPRSSFPWADLP